MTSRIVTLSSVGVSAFVNLDWRQGKGAVVQASQASSAVAIDFTVQATLIDVQSSATLVWFNLSSGVWGANGPFPSSAGHLSSATFDSNVVYVMDPPPAAVRLQSTTNASSVAITLRVLQGD